jgi:putative transposase
VYGYRKLTWCLVRKYRLCINKKKVYRLCKELGILLPQRERRNQPPRKLANNRVITGPNQLWQLDIKYGYIAGKRRFFYLASIIDVFDRNIIAHHKGKECSTKDILKVVHKALLKRNIHMLNHQLAIRTDNGPQFISRKFHEFCQEQGIEHERIPNHTPNKNAYIESFHSVLERECYQRHSFETFEEAFSIVDDYIRFYNERRYHGSLRGLSPVEYLRRLQANEIAPMKIAV